jgi:hypothetical protein
MVSKQAVHGGFCIFGISFSQRVTRFARRESHRASRPRGTLSLICVESANASANCSALEVNEAKVKTYGIGRRAVWRTPWMTISSPLTR